MYVSDNKRPYYLKMQLNETYIDIQSYHPYIGYPKMFPIYRLSKDVFFILGIKEYFLSPKNMLSLSLGIRKYLRQP